MTRRMTQEQALSLVAYLNRAGMLQAMEGQAAVWRDALEGVRYLDAQEAARSLVRRPGLHWLSPGDLLAEVRAIRKARIADRVVPAPPVELDVDTEFRFRRAYLAALGDGASEPQADAEACKAVGVTRTQAPAANAGRLRKVLEAAAQSIRAPREGGR
jgi:hypothetical protein